MKSPVLSSSRAIVAVGLGTPVTVMLIGWFHTAYRCDMNLYDFISTASQAGITIIDYGIEEKWSENSQC